MIVFTVPNSPSCFYHFCDGFLWAKFRNFRLFGFGVYVGSWQLAYPNRKSTLWTFKSILLLQCLIWFFFFCSFLLFLVRLTLFLFSLYKAIKYICMCSESRHPSSCIYRVCFNFVSTSIVDVLLWLFRWKIMFRAFFLFRWKILT